MAVSKEYYQSIKEQAESLKQKIVKNTNLERMEGGIFCFSDIVYYVTVKYDVVQLVEEPGYRVMSYRTGVREIPFYGQKIYAQIQGLDKITIDEKAYQELIRIEWLMLVQAHFKLKQRKMQIFPLELYCISPALIKRVVMAEDKEVDDLINRYRNEKHWLTRSSINKVKDPMNYDYDIFVATPEYIEHLLSKNPTNGVLNMYELHGCIILKPSCDFKSTHHFIHDESSNTDNE